MSHGMASPRPGVVSEDQVRLQLKGLQHEVERTATLARWLGWLAVLLIALLIALAISIYLYHVMQYASVTSVAAADIAGRPDAAEISFEPDSAGMIEFVRESAGVVEIVTEYANFPPTGDPKRKFTWQGKVDKNPTLRATYRRGLFLVTQDLPLAGAGAKK